MAPPPPVPTRPSVRRRQATAPPPPVPTRPAPAPPGHGSGPARADAASSVRRRQATAPPPPVPTRPTPSPFAPPMRSRPAPSPFARPRLSPPRARPRPRHGHLHPAAPRQLRASTRPGDLRPHPATARHTWLCPQPFAAPGAAPFVAIVGVAPSSSSWARPRPPPWARGPVRRRRRAAPSSPRARPLAAVRRRRVDSTCGSKLAADAAPFDVAGAAPSSPRARSLFRLQRLPAGVKKREPAAPP
nr:vegetative cell wall protein gp1-like [Lolium perenne]